MDPVIVAANVNVADVDATAPEGPDVIDVSGILEPQPGMRKLPTRVCQLNEWVIG